MMSREVLPEFIENVCLSWETPRSNNSVSYDGHPMIEPHDIKPIKTRDDYVAQVQQALEEHCLEQMLEPSTDGDLICAVHVLSITSCGTPIVLPQSTHATDTAVRNAGYNSLEGLVGSINQELRTMSKEAALV